MRSEHQRTAVVEERRELGALTDRLPALRPPPAPEHIDTAAFDFMKALAGDLHASRLQLPSPPDVAIKIRHALNDNHANLERVRRVVSADPVLVGRLIAAANSAAARGAEPVSDLKTAILRLGLGVVYNFAMILSLRQVLDVQVPAELRTRLKAEWLHAIRVATIAQVVARDLTPLDPHKAHLAGLLHGIGRLYILKRAKEHSALIANDAALDLVMSAWHNEVGFALARHWGLADELCTAVREYESHDLARDGPASFTTVICVANRIARGMGAHEGASRSPPPAPGLPGVSENAWLAIMKEVRDELDHLLHVLGLD